MRRCALLLALVSILIPAAVRALAPPAGGPPPLDPRMPELFRAVGRDDAAAVKRILSGGVDPEVRNFVEMTPLIYAAAANRPAAARALLAAGAKVNTPSPMGSALTMAETDGHEAMATLLLDQGAAPEAARRDGIQPLMLAAWHGQLNLTRRLLDKGARVDARNNDAATALSYAARGGSAEVVSLLLERGAAVDAADSRGWTPLMYAAGNGRAAAAKALLAKGAGHSARESRGRTPLLLSATYGGDADTVRCLLDGGADPNSKDNRGRTALAIAASRSYAPVVELLKARTSGTAVSKARSPRDAAVAGLTLIQSSQATFVKKLGCVSCHHQSLGMLTMAVARQQGFRVDEKLAKGQLDRCAEGGEAFTPFYQAALKNPELAAQIPFGEIDELDTADGWVLAGLAAEKVPASPGLAMMTTLLARRQAEDGHWGFTLPRVPSQSSRITTTALAVKNLQTYPPQEGPAEAKKRIARARTWLATATAPTSEDRAFRLLGLKWAGAGGPELEAAAAAVRKDQRPDGGWAQLDALRSDAYATGQALYALLETGRIAPTDPVVRKGIGFLCRMQDDDGSWFVNKRAAPLNFYTDVGFPHGESQYVSFAGTCWATMALMKSERATSGQTGRK